MGGAQRDAEIAYVDELRRRIDEAGLAERVQLLGARDDARAVIAAADIYCQPNLEPEPFGLSLVEAMYAGLPVVTSAAGGALEIVDETCGVLTAPGDVTRRGRRARPADRRRAAARPAGLSGVRRAAAPCAPPTAAAPHRARAGVGAPVQQRPPAGRGDRGEAGHRRCLSRSYDCASRCSATACRSKAQKRGGIERAADTLAQGLVERGHHVVVFSHDRRPDGAGYAVRAAAVEGASSKPGSAGG